MDLPDAKSRLVLPLDVPDLDSARRWIDRLGDEVGVFKVGLQLYTAAGPAAVEAVHAAGADCFLDLKLHDIPATMAHAVAAASDLGVAYLTVHAAAGPAAMRAITKAAGATRLLAVTVLTSMDASELEAIGLQGSSEEAVLRLARVATESGVSGLVCSPHECATLRGALGVDPLLMVPGIRPAGAALGDQRRAATPETAISSGADMLVVGRPIRNADDPVEAARSVVAEIQSALPSL